MNQKELCVHCGDYIPEEDGYYFEDHFLCPNCLEELTMFCHLCGERILREDNHGTDDIPLCGSCYENHYTHCVAAADCFTKGISTTTRTMPCAGTATKPVRGNGKPFTITTISLRPFSSAMAHGSSGSNWRWTKPAKILTMLRRFWD